MEPLDASKHGNLDKFKKELAAKPKGEQKGFLQEGALNAVKLNEPDILKYCLSEGASPFDNDVFYAACKSGSPDVFGELVAAGMTPDFQQTEGDPTLLMTLIYYDNLPALAYLFFAHGASINDIGLSNRYYPFLSGVKSAKVMAFLLEHGATIPNSLALHTAAGDGNVELMRFLVEQGADVNEIPRDLLPDTKWLFEQSKRNGAPLHWAAEGRELNAVKFLLDSGADAQLKDAQGRDIWERSKVLSDDGTEVWQELVDELSRRGS